MKTKVLTLLALALAAVSAHAQSITSIGLTMGVMRTSTGSVATDGGIFMIVADTTGNGFASLSTDTTLSVGSSLALGGDDKILGVFNIDSSSSGMGGVTLAPLQLDYTSGLVSQGNALQLYWFPSISAIGSNLTLGASYGSFRNGSAVGGDIDSIAWFAPAPSASSINLAFATTSVGGSYAENLGWANNVVAAVPEPAATAVLLGALGASVILLRRRKQRAAA